MYAQMPPLRCASATTWVARVVLPEPSGPKISTTLPRGMPPMPSARSSARAPVGTVSIDMEPLSPIFMTAPAPNCFSIWPRAMSRALVRSAPASRSPPLIVLPCFGMLVAPFSPDPRGPGQVSGCLSELSSATLEKACDNGSGTNDNSVIANRRSMQVFSSESVVDGTGTTVGGHG